MIYLYIAFFCCFIPFFVMIIIVLIFLGFFVLKILNNIKSKCWISIFCFIYFLRILENDNLIAPKCRFDIYYFSLSDYVDCDHKIHCNYFFASFTSFFLLFACEQKPLLLISFVLCVAALLFSLFNSIDTEYFS